MFDDPGPGGLPVGVVHSGVALEIGGVQHLGLKPDGAVLQIAQLVAEVGIDGAGVDDLVRQSVQFGLVLQIVHIQANLDAIEHIGHHFGVAAHGDALVQSVEVVVIEGEADRQTLDDEGGQVLAVAAPLLLGVALDQLLIDVGANEGDGLLLQILGLGDAGGALLLLDLGLGLLRRDHTPHLIKGIHVEGQRIELALVIGHGGVGEPVEGGELVDVVPDLGVVGVEDVSAVDVDVDALHLFGVDVAGDVGALVDDQNLLAGVSGGAGAHSTVQAGADDQIIIMRHREISLYIM